MDSNPVQTRMNALNSKNTHNENNQNMHKEHNNNTIQTPNQPNKEQQTKNTFANALKNQNNFPKKNQGIIINAVEGLQMKDYVLAVGAVIGPENITHCARLSNNRINFYLKNKNIAENFVKNNKILNINNTHVTVRHLVNPNKRLIFNNVDPTIPHEVIENKLREIGLKLTSEMNSLRAGIHEAGYQHILSNRRQIFVEDEENTIIPESFKIDYEETSYRIYISDDSEYCVFCKKHGHKEEKCHNKKRAENNQETHQPEDKQTEPHEEQTPQKKLENDIELKETVQNKENNTSNQTQDNELPVYTKRPASPLTTPPEEREEEVKEPNLDNSTENVESTASKNKIVKKHKRSTSPGTPIEEWLKPARHLFKKPHFILTYEQFYNLTDNIYNHPNPLVVAQEYTENMKGLLQVMQELYDFTKNRSARMRLKQAINKIGQQLELETESGEESMSE